MLYNSSFHSFIHSIIFSFFLFIHSFRLSARLSVHRSVLPSFIHSFLPSFLSSFIHNTPGHLVRKLGQSLRPKMAPILNQGCLKTGNEINQLKKCSLVFLGYHERKACGKYRREVRFFFILIPNSTSVLLILPSTDTCFFVPFQEYCMVMKFSGISAWNALPQYIKLSQSLAHFKTLMRKRLLMDNF